MRVTFTESVIEEAALAWLESVGWQVRNGDEIAPASPPPNATATGRWSWRNGCAMHSSRRICGVRLDFPPSANVEH